jgi:hypothetical protein
MNDRKSISPEAFSPIKASRFSRARAGGYSPLKRNDITTTTSGTLGLPANAGNTGTVSGPNAVSGIVAAPAVRDFFKS